MGKNPSPSAPPVARKIPHRWRRHGRSTEDHYHWLRSDRWREVLCDPETLPDEIRAHLEAENRYTEQSMASTRALQAELYREMRGRMPEQRDSVPVADGAYAYFWRYCAGEAYERYLRQPRNGGREETLLDVNRLAEGQPHCVIGHCEHSPNHRYFAYSVDLSGAERYQLCVLDIGAGQTLEPSIEDCSGEWAWAADAEHLLYVRCDDHCRPFQLWCHRLGQPPERDVLLFEEGDPGFFLSLETHLSRRWISLKSADHNTDEVYLIDAQRPLQAPRLVAARETGVEYSLFDWGEHWLIHTNWPAQADYQLVWAPAGAPDKAHWQPFYQPESGVTLLACRVYRQYLLLLERCCALPRLRWCALTPGDPQPPLDFQQLDWPEAAYALTLGEAYEVEAHTALFAYQSPSTPEQWYELDLRSGDKHLRQRTVLPVPHNPADYSVRRLWVNRRDGASIPVTLVQRSDTPDETPRPLLLYAYGAYGASTPADFSGERLSLLDRGWVYAIAHVRGGMECGYAWYEAGKGRQKHNTFEDVVAVLEALHAEGISEPKQSVIHGASAGGLLVGAVINARPELLAGALAEVPFVDVLNTLCDPELPLTPIEWPEWGNPITCEADYRYIASYSPYDNVCSQGYPALLATAGLSDSRVTYWEAAKWVAKLREQGASAWLKTEMQAGHQGVSGRYEALREQAFLYAFVLACAL